MNSPKGIVITGAIVMAIAVALGAFGAHAMKAILTPARLETWQTAVDYHFYHGLGLLLCGILYQQYPQANGISTSAKLLLTGISIFCGSLYLLCLTEQTWLGAVTPLGGIAFIVGWILLARGVLKS